MKKALLLLLITATMVPIATAQSYAENATYGDPDTMILFGMRKHYFKWNVAAAFTLNPSVEFAYEWRKDPRVAYQIEVGYINQLYNNADPNYGLRVKVDYRRYAPNRTFYIAPGLFFKYQRFFLNDRVCMEGDEWNCIFWQDLEYEAEKKVLAFRANFGWQWEVWEAFLVDIGGGMGVRVMQIDHFGLPPGVSASQDWWSFWDNYTRAQKEGFWIMPDLSIAMRFGFLF